MYLDCKGQTLDLTTPIVMGVLNVTPDSFSDGGHYLELNAALDRALRMVEDGAAVIDIGGESTRPGAEPVNEAQELDRVLPVIEALAGKTTAVLSIDTMKPAVMQAACAAGAGLINDVNALRAEGALDIAIESQAAVCLMHMQGEPRTMQSNPSYNDVCAEVSDFLLGRVRACTESGMGREKIVIDPGFGFGKSLQHNLTLMQGLEQIVKEGYPVLVGVSRKSLLGALLDVPPADRIYGGVAAATLAVWQGAKIIRTHDVRPTADAIKVASAIQQQRD